MEALVAREGVDAASVAPEGNEATGVRRDNEASV
jgi:hypothetical protein